MSFEYILKTKMESVIRDEEWTVKVIYMKRTSKKSCDSNGFPSHQKTCTLYHHV